MLLKPFTKLRFFLRRSFLWRLIFSLGVLGLLCLLGGNLWLNSSPGKNFLINKASEKSGMHVEFASTYWLPWSGLVLSDVDLYNSPDGTKLSTIQSMQLRPHWPSLLEKKLKLATVVVNAPKFELSENQLMDFLSKIERPSKPPQAGVKPLPKEGGQEPARGKTQKPSKPASPKQPSKPPPTNPPQAVKKDKKPEAVPKPKQPQQLESEHSMLSRLEMKDASFILREESGEVLIEMESVDLSYPLQGNPGALKIGKALVAGESWLENFKIEINQDNKEIKAVMEPQRVGPFTCSGAWIMDFYGKFLTRGKVELSDTLESNWNGATVVIERAKIMGEMSGNLKSLNSWKARTQLKASEASLSHPSKRVAFDSIEAQLLLKSCRLAVEQFKADSAELKLRGGGVINTTGDSSGTLRVIATEDEGHNVARFFGGIQIHFPMDYFPNTQDVLYNDVELRGKLWDLEFKTNKHWRKLKERLRRMSRFLDVEREEEHRER